VGNRAGAGGPWDRRPGLLPGTIRRLYGHAMPELAPGMRPMGALPVRARSGGKVPARSRAGWSCPETLGA